MATELEKAQALRLTNKASAAELLYSLGDQLIDKSMNICYRLI